MDVFSRKSREWLLAAIDDVEDAIAATTSEESNPVVGALKTLSYDQLMKRHALLERALAKKDGLAVAGGARFIRGYGRQ